MATNSGLPNVLAEILVNKREELVQAMDAVPLKELERRAAEAPASRDLRAVLTREPGGAVRILAEIKRRSPSAGEIAPEIDPVEIARQYEAAGADAISVLTDEMYFGGCLADLSAVRAAVALPVLRKDFIIDAYQVWEARAAGPTPSC